MLPGIKWRQQTNSLKTSPDSSRMLATYIEKEGRERKKKDDSAYVRFRGIFLYYHSHETDDGATRVTKKYDGCSQSIILVVVAAVIIIVINPELEFAKNLSD